MDYFDPKEYANWLVSRGVPTEKLVCPMCESTEILRAMRPASMYHLDKEGNIALHPQQGYPLAVITVPIACGNCGFLRLFVLNPDALPEAENGWPPPS